MKRLVPLIVGCIGLLGCAALLLVIAYRHNLRIDLTPTRSYTLSTHARRIVESLEHNVELLVFVRSADPRTPQLKDLLWRVANASPRVTYDIVDLNRSPALARKYGVDRYGAIIVQSEGRRRDIANPTEGLLISALLGISRTEEPIAYFVTGHGEYSPKDTDRKRGYSQAAIALEDDLFQVKTVPLLTTAVPSDAAMLVLAGPRKDLLPGERERLLAFVQSGGDLLLLLDPETPAGIARLVSDLGVTALEELVIDPEARLSSGEGRTFKVASLEPRFVVSAALEAAPVFSSARPLEIDESATGIVSFLRTSAAGYTVASDASAVGAPRLRPGPLVLGAAILPTASASRRGRIIVLGDADFATNGLIDYLGSKDLVVNAAHWLVRQESLVAARATRKEAGREQFFVTDAQSTMAFWLAAVVQPGIFLLAGAFVLWRRRSA